MSKKPPTIPTIPFDLPLWSAKFVRGGRVAVRTRAALEHTLIGRALRDAVFRHELIAHPKSAVERELGYELPAELHIEILEESGVRRFLVIPDRLLAPDRPGPATLAQAAEWAMEGRRISLLSRHQAFDLVIEAWSETGFQERLLRDPNGLLYERFGLLIEPEATLEVRLETADQLYIVIPDLFGYNELSDDEYAEFVSFVNEPMVIGSPSLCTVKTTESPYGCGPH
jgi:hypothetical protein